MIDDYGHFAPLAPLLALHDRLRQAGLDADNDLVWLLPDETLPGVTMAYGLPVERTPGLAPTLGLRPATQLPASSTTHQ